MDLELRLLRRSCVGSTSSERREFCPAGALDRCRRSVTPYTTKANRRPRRRISGASCRSIASTRSDSRGAANDLDVIGEGGLQNKQKHCAGAVVALVSLHVGLCLAEGQVWVCRAEGALGCHREAGKSCDAAEVATPRDRSVATFASSCSWGSPGILGAPCRSYEIHRHWRMMSRLPSLRHLMFRARLAQARLVSAHMLARIKAHGVHLYSLGLAAALSQSCHIDSTARITRLCDKGSAKRKGDPCFVRCLGSTPR